MRDEFPQKLDSKNESADAIVNPRSVTLHTSMPMNQIYQLVAEMFGQVSSPENKPFMEEASTHWQQNNTDELKDPSLEIDFAMGEE